MQVGLDAKMAKVSTIMMTNLPMSWSVHHVQTAPPVREAPGLPDYRYASHGLPF